jgi:3-hydroxy-9,10-secoandrosta-1,3,5(10)-triene-9,17-dione monooxygenase reductase component
VASDEDLDDDDLVGDDVEGAPAAGGSTIGQAEFRTVLGHFASGVVIVTGQTSSGPGGFTCQSFFSLSLDPPLVAFAPGVTSSSWPGIEAAGSCTVNVLSEEQEALARAFSRSGSDKFAGVGWSAGATGAPRLDRALAWIDCRLDRVIDGGDHRLVVAHVVELGSRHGDPLLFYRGGFGTFRA